MTAGLTGGLRYHRHWLETLVGLDRRSANAVMREIGDGDHFDADDLILYLYEHTTYAGDSPRAVVASVYIARDGDGAVLYVGITGRNIKRLHQHSRAAAWWPQVVTFDIEHFVARDAAEARERKLIVELDPPHNIKGRVAA